MAIIIAFCRELVFGLVLIVTLHKNVFHKKNHRIITIRTVTVKSENKMKKTIFPTGYFSKMDNRRQCKKEVRLILCVFAGK
jgi:hypothetical protein